MDPMEIERLAAQAGQAAALLRLLGNEQRLLILCHLVEAGELNVGALQARMALGQSALSQHLARLRDEAVVECRRDGQNLYYRVADDRAASVLELLHQLYCAPQRGDLE